MSAVDRLRQIEEHQIEQTELSQIIRLKDLRVDRLSELTNFSLKGPASTGV